MGNGTTRCLKVDGLRKELRRLDGDLIVRFRDGDVKYPGIYLMREDRTDHVDIGLPYPVRDRLAEIDRAVRKADRRPPPPKPKVWVLVRRYEREDRGNQTEYCDTFVFAKKESALAKARSLMRSDLRKYGDGTKAVAAKEIVNMERGFEGKFPRHLVRLTDSDNVVYELYRRTIG